MIVGKIGNVAGFTSASRRVFTPVLVGCLALLAAGTAGASPEPPGLFSHQQGLAAGMVPPGHAKARKTRGVKINHGQLRSARFFVNLPGGVSYEAVRQQLQDFGGGRTAWVGHARGNPDNRVVLGTSGDAVAGTFAYQGKLFKLEPRAGGAHVLSEVTASDPAPLLDPIPITDTAGDESGAPASGGAAAAGGSTIDVLVAYTPAVESLYGVAGTDALVIQAVAETNQAYANSQMTTQLNLVHTVRTNYTETGSMHTDLGRLSTNGDAYMDELHALRNQYGADVVSLIENQPQYCGLAYRMTYMAPGFASNAFSVVHHSCATGYFSFGHEIGHNQGAHHDKANAGSAIFPYAYGYQDPGGAFRTVMAYNCPGDCTRIGLFSHEDNPLFTLPTGISGKAENARTIDETAATVAAFRQNTPLPPVAPSSLSALANGSNEVDLAWTDNAGNETDFLVERSENGLNYAQVATLPADTQAYVDAGLTQDTLYYYRVRANNGAGYSGYSNVAMVTTALPPFTDHYVVGENTAIGLPTGSAADTEVDDEVVQSVQEVQFEVAPGQNSSVLEQYWAFDVSPGQAITLLADIDTDAGVQSFTFAYSTELTTLEANPGAWVDMFTIDVGGSGAQQFSLPADVSGLVLISARDNSRTVGEVTADSLHVDYLVIRTDNTTGQPPGC